jgi:uncharacterized membrane protein
MQILLPLTVLATGLAAGGLVISVLGGAPLLLALPKERYVPIHQFLVTRFDPFMPICLIVGLVGDILIAVVAEGGAARALSGVAAVLLLAAVSVSLTKNVPINKWVATLDPAALPSDWERLDPRLRWRNWNLVRTVLTVGALLANVVAVAVSLR